MIRAVRYTLLAAIAVGLLTTLPGEVPCCAITYELEPRPQAGVVDVSMTIYGFDGDSLILLRPSDRPLEGLLAQDPEIRGAERGRWDVVDGAPRWAFERPPSGWSDPVRVRYRLAITAERPVNAWSVGLGDEALYAPAEALFLVPEMPEKASLHAPVRVRWALPDRWDVFVGWDSHTFYGVRKLIRANVLAGRIERHREYACGLSIDLAAHGEWDFSTKELVDDLASLACAARNRLGDPGVDRFAVTLVPARFPMTSGNRNGPNTIGLVHQVPDGSRPSIRLLSHELVHLWQQYDAPLWFQEGVNDYLALRLAWEAGLFDDGDYFSMLTSIDATYRAHPRRRSWSFETEEQEAPAFGASDEYLAYRKGAIVGLALDRELRLRTGGEIDVARLWREMNQRASWGHVEWTADEIANRSAALIGANLSRFFGEFVHGTTDLPEVPALLANLPPLADPVPDSGGLGVVAAFIQATFE